MVTSPKIYALILIYKFKFIINGPAFNTLKTLEGRCVRVDASTILRFLIANSFNAGDFKVAHNACRALTDSSAAIAQILNDKLAKLTYYFQNSVIDYVKLIILFIF